MGGGRVRVRRNGHIVPSVAAFFRPHTPVCREKVGGCWAESFSLQENAAQGVRRIFLPVTNAKLGVRVLGYLVRSTVSNGH